MCANIELKCPGGKEHEVFVFNSFLFYYAWLEK